MAADPEKPARVEAPANPAVTRAQRAADLKAKGSKRTPAEAAELIDVLTARVDDLEHRLDQFAAGR